MRKIKVLLAILISFAIITQIHAEDKKRIAVIPFKYGGGVTKDEVDYLMERIRTELINTGKFEVISNDQLDAMMKMKQQKQGVGSGSCTTEQCVIDLGNALECEKMMVGSAMGAFGEFAINGKIMDVVTQQYERAKDLRIKTKNEFPDAAKEMVEKLTSDYKGAEEYEPEVEEIPEGPVVITYTGILWRTFVLPGWGHVYAGQKRGYLYAAGYAAVGGIWLWSHMNYNSQQKIYDDATDTVSADLAYLEANGAHALRGYMSYLFIAVTAAAITDIMITGKRYTTSNLLPLGNGANTTDGWFFDMKPSFTNKRSSNQNYKENLNINLRFKKVFK